jgi:hypothetical protein
MAAKRKSDIAAYKRDRVRESATKSTGIKQLFNNQVAAWHQSQHEKYAAKSAKYRDREASAQAADAAAVQNAQSARADADIIRAEAELTRNPAELDIAARAEHIAEQAAKAQQRRQPASIRGKIERGKQHAGGIEQQLQAADRLPEPIREKQKAKLLSALISTQTDTNHPYGPDQGSKLTRIMPTINNRERAFADTDMDGTAGGRKFQSLFTERRPVLQELVRSRARQIGLGALIGA